MSTTSMNMRRTLTLVSGISALHLGFELFAREQTPFGGVGNAAMAMLSALAFLWAELSSIESVATGKNSTQRVLGFVTYCTMMLANGIVQTSYYSQQETALLHSALGWWIVMVAVGVASQEAAALYGEQTETRRREEAAREATETAARKAAREAAEERERERREQLAEKERLVWEQEQARKAQLAEAEQARQFQLEMARIEAEKAIQLAQLASGRSDTKSDNGRTGVQDDVQPSDSDQTDDQEDDRLDILRSMAPVTPSEVADKFNVTDRTARRWMSAAGLVKNGDGRYHLEG